MKVLLTILMAYICCNAISQDSAPAKPKYVIATGFGIAVGEYIYGGPSLNIAIGTIFSKNQVLFSFSGYTELQIFGAMQTTLYEVSLAYHRSFPIGKLEPSLGAGISVNKHIIDTARFSGNTSFKTVDMTNAGCPVYVSLAYNMGKWKIQAQYHYNFNSINKFQIAALDFCFVL
jgi:hypothetical protein